MRPALLIPPLSGCSAVFVVEQASFLSPLAEVERDNAQKLNRFHSIELAGVILQLEGLCWFLFLMETDYDSVCVLCEDVSDMLCCADK